MYQYVRFTAMAALVMLAMPGRAFAQLDGCGSIEKQTEMRQWNPPTLAVEAKFSTSRDITFLCPIVTVRAEGWVHGYGGAVSSNGTYTAEVTALRGVYGNGTYQATGRHFAISLGNYWYALGESWGQTQVAAPMAFCPLDPGSCDGGAGFDPVECRCVYSPVIFDTANDGYHLTSVEDGVLFDLDGDGVRERTAWTAEDSDDALLAFDRNGNGTIDNGLELFGNATPAYANAVMPKAANGFEALRLTEGPSFGVSVPDMEINASDAIFPHLLLWRDLNHNGLSEPAELTSAAAEGLVSISTDYRDKRRRDEHGNQFKQRAQSVWRDARGRLRTRQAFDIWFATQ